MGKIIRLQGSDFQDAGLEGNLSKLETLVAHANHLTEKGEDVAGLDLVGDFYDTHDTTLVKAIKENKSKEIKKKDPDLLKKILNFEKIRDEFNAKIQQTQQPPTQEDQLKIQQAITPIEENKDALEYLSIGHGMAAQNLYNIQERSLSRLKKTKVYGVRGNNDTNYIQDVLKSVKFSDMEENIIEDGPFNIVGANNTNYDGEIAYDERFLVECDDSSDLEKSKAYQKFKKEKTGKKANIIQLHGPPNWIDLRDGKDNDAVGITKLIDEHKPGLVECGHFHTAELKTIDGVRYARSSPGYYFEHEFEDDGSYVATNIYKYAA